MNLAEILAEKEDWKTAFYTPSGKQIGLSLLLIGVGFAVTMGIEKIGGGEEPNSDSSANVEA